MSGLGTMGKLGAAGAAGVREGDTHELPATGS